MSRSGGTEGEALDRLRSLEPKRASEARRWSLARSSTKRFAGRRPATRATDRAAPTARFRVCRWRRTIGVTRLHPPFQSVWAAVIGTSAFAGPTKAGHNQRADPLSRSITVDLPTALLRDLLQLSSSVGLDDDALAAPLVSLVEGLQTAVPSYCALHLTVVDIDHPVTLTAFVPPQDVESITTSLRVGFAALGPGFDARAVSSSTLRRLARSSTWPPTSDMPSAHRSSQPVVSRYVDRQHRRRRTA